MPFRTFGPCTRRPPRWRSWGDARPVRVEAHVGRQSEAFKLSGLPDTAVREAKDRVRAAVASAGIRFPNRTVTVNLAPADLPKGGTDYDLPIALGILAASREIHHFMTPTP